MAHEYDDVMFIEMAPVSIKVSLIHYDDTNMFKETCILDHDDTVHRPAQYCACCGVGPQVSSTVW